jgi:hypothetical protein
MMILLAMGRFSSSPVGGLSALKFIAKRATIVADEAAFKRKNPAGDAGRSARRRARTTLGAARRRGARNHAAHRETCRSRSASQVSAVVATHKNHREVLELTCVDLATMLVTTCSLSSWLGQSAGRPVS